MRTGQRTPQRGPSTAPASHAVRAAATPGQRALLALQRTAGNRAVARLIQSPAPAPAPATPATPPRPTRRSGGAAARRVVARVPVLGMIGGAALGYCALSSYYESFRDTDAFLRDFQRETGRPARREEWDEWGHEYIACRMTERCGHHLTAIAGDSMEAFHELLSIASGGRIEHDSLLEDLSAEARGRRHGQRDADCYLQTLSDVTHGELALPSDYARRVGALPR